MADGARLQQSRGRTFDGGQRLTGSVLFLLAGLAALGTLATNIILPSFPAMGVDLGVSSQQLGLTLSSFFIAFACGQLVVGPLSDRLGRKRVVMAGLVVFVAGCILCASAGTLSVLIARRVIQALGACAASVLSRAIARDLFDGEALARALAMSMIAGATAPGFSPLVGSALDGLLGWRVTFLIVSAFGVALALHYWMSIGETHPADRRATVNPLQVASSYYRLAVDPRFFFPAMSVSLIIGGLYTFFSSAPAVLMDDLGLTPIQLGLSFASTVLVVFMAGFLAPRLAKRWGRDRVAAAGLVIALIGSIMLFAFAAAPSYLSYTAAIVLFLFGMGLVNPLGTVIALGPFGDRAGLASALLGFTQMSCAAMGSLLASLLPVPPFIALATILTAGTALALLAFMPVVLNEMSERTKAI